MNSELNKYISILNVNFDHLQKVFSVKKIAIFGSVARGDNTPVSDIDILVEFNKPVGFFQFIRLETYLKRILGKKIDLATQNALKSKIKKQIIQEAIYV